VAIALSWAKCQLITTIEAVDAITHILERHNINGIEIDYLEKGKSNEKMSVDDVQLIFYLSSDIDVSEKVNQIIKEIKHLTTLNINVGSIASSIEFISDDWMNAWEKHYQSIQVSEQMTIVPTWKRQNLEVDSNVVIELDPGLAFGTGDHATTLMMLRALQKYSGNKQVVIDVGSGSGILSIASLLLGVKKVFAIDNDPQAIKSTERNAQLNGVDQSLIVNQGNLLSDIEVSADLIIANILAEVIVELAEDAYNHLKSGGYFITSGIIQRKKQMVSNQLEKSQFKIIETFEQDGWICIVAQK